MKVYDSFGNWLEYFGRQIRIDTQNLELGFCENGEIRLCLIRIQINPVHLLYICQLQIWLYGDQIDIELLNVRIWRKNQFENCRVRKYVKLTLTLISFRVELWIPHAVQKHEFLYLELCFYVFWQISRCNKKISVI